MSACKAKTVDRDLVATASVLSVERRDDGCTLLLSPPVGDAIIYELDTVPDGEAARLVELTSGRVLALKLTASDGELSSSALVTSGRGPARISVPIGAALALCESGIHTVLVTDTAPSS